MRYLQVGLIVGLIFVFSSFSQVFSTVSTPQLLEVSADNKGRCVEFFLIQQKMFCATSPLFTAQVNKEALKYEPFKLVFDNRRWVAGWGQHNTKINTVEYIPSGQNVEAWNELITTQFQPSLQQKITPMQYANFTHKNLIQQGYDPDFIVHESTSKEVIFEFKVKKPLSEAQDEIQRVISTPDGLYFLHYVIRQPDMSSNNRQTWLSNLKQATLK